MLSESIEHSAPPADAKDAPKALNIRWKRIGIITAGTCSALLAVVMIGAEYITSTVNEKMKTGPLIRLTPADVLSHPQRPPRRADSFTKESYRLIDYTKLCPTTPIILDMIHPDGTVTQDELEFFHGPDGPLMRLNDLKVFTIMDEVPVEFGYVMKDFKLQWIVLKNEPARHHVHFIDINHAGFHFSSQTDAAKNMKYEISLPEITRIFMYLSGSSLRQERMQIEGIIRSPDGDRPHTQSVTFALLEEYCRPLAAPRMTAKQQ